MTDVLGKLHGIPLVNKFMIIDPEITAERDSSGALTRYCVDADTEHAMQRIRLFAMVVGGPTVIYAGWKADVPWWQKIGIMSMGAACSIHHFYAWKEVKEAEIKSK